jgi:hypothetical protein
MELVVGHILGYRDVEAVTRIAAAGIASRIVWVPRQVVSVGRNDEPIAEIAGDLGPGEVRLRQIVDGRGSGPSQIRRGR